MSAALLWLCLYDHCPVLSCPHNLFSFPLSCHYHCRYFLTEHQQHICSLFPSDLCRAQMTCLMLAAKSGYSKVINLLMSYGAEINAQDKYGYTVSHYISLVYCVWPGLNYIFFSSGLGFSGAAWHTGGSDQAPPVRSRQNLKNKHWQLPCWLGCNLWENRGTVLWWYLPKNSGYTVKTAHFSRALIWWVFFLHKCHPKITKPTKKITHY